MWLTGRVFSVMLRRACKHPKALQSIRQLGHNAVVVYCIQRGDASTVQPACDIDPEYAHECDLARDVVIYDPSGDV